MNDFSNHGETEPVDSVGFCPQVILARGEGSLWVVVLRPLWTKWQRHQRLSDEGIEQAHDDASVGREEFYV